jgi:thiamine pyrophosphate-dependent acetolactate synthase large subunit-like protein
LANSLVFHALLFVKQYPLKSPTLQLLGTNFPYRQFYPSHAKVVQVDIAGEAIGRRCSVELGVIGDIKETLRAVLPLLKKQTNSRFLEKAIKHYQIPLARV